MEPSRKSRAIESSLFLTGRFLGRSMVSDFFLDHCAIVCHQHTADWIYQNQRLPDGRNIEQNSKGPRIEPCGTPNMHEE